jgi:hypothetical protein
MITNEIQELLEGSLSDERMAELLHRLSVSPEKRAAFRQHMALDAAIQHDRTASALTGLEDAAIWAAVSGGTAATTSSGPTSTLLGWFARSAAVVVIGVGTYLLGANPSTNIFRSGATDHPAVAQQAAPAERTATGSTSQDISSPSATASQPIAERSGEESAADRSTMLKQNPSVSTTTSAGSRSNSGSGSQNVVQERAGTALTHRSQQPHERISLPSKQTVPASESTSRTTQPFNNPNSTKPNDLGSTEAKPVEPETKPAPEMRHAPSDIPAEMPATIAALRTNGFEFGFSERVGKITPTPQGINDPDPEFSNRSLDFSIRFLEGRLGIGARGTYGTFSSVRLEASANEETGVVDSKPKLEAQKGLVGEFFVNYRFPLGERFAIGAELSGGGSSTYTKGSADLLGLWFVSDRIGIQAGIGLGNYWYNLNSQREQFFKEHPNAAIDSDAMDSYHGTMIEARYGLLYRF